MTDVRVENVRLIREGAAYLAAPERVLRMRAQRHCPPGFTRADWQETADLGWLGLRLGGDRGGAGFGMEELCAFAEQMGMGLAAEPLLGAILTVPLLPAEQIEAVLSGATILLPALAEARDAFGAASTLAVKGGRLTGVKRYIHMGADADMFFVSVEDGFALVEKDAPGLTLDVTETQDGGHFATLGLAGTPAVAVSALPDAAARLEQELTLATAAYLLGVMRRAFAITADYLGTRQQFDRPIGSFQALQHRMVDLYIQIELTAASVRCAARALEGNDFAAARLAVARAKARASDASMLVTRQGVQLHGGIGYTDEADIGLYLRKAMTLANLHGGAARHRARFAAITDLGGVQ